MLFVNKHNSQFSDDDVSKIESYCVFIILKIKPLCKNVKLNDQKNATKTGVLINTSPKMLLFFEE